MATEQYSIGYEEGFQNGWNAAVDSLSAQRKPLTPAQINAFFEGMEPNNGFWLSFARAIEAAHGIKEKT